jgi:hypothetical protein
MISINDIFLPVPTGDVYAYQAQFQEMLESGIFCSEPAAVKSSRNASILSPNGIGIPRLNYPPLPPARLNTIIWPSGATRWARAYFVATGDVKDKIVSTAGDANATSVTLKIGESNPISLDMFLLPPRPLSSQGTDDNNTDQIWILPFVDGRFLNQFTNSGSTLIARGDSWSTFVGKLSPKLGSSPASEYLKPDWNELSRPFGNDALLSDAVAASIGTRVSADFDGTLSFNFASDDQDSLDENLNLKEKLIAGNSFTDENSLQPASVRVVFRKFADGVGKCDGSEYDYSNNAPDGNPILPDTELVISSTAYADFGTGSGTPDNDTVLSALAKQISDDYYAWSGQLYDLTFAGIVKWTPTGFDNYVEFRFGSIGPSGLQDFTRAVSMPANFYAEQQLSQDSSLNIIDSQGVKGKYAGSDNGGGDWMIGTSAKVRVYTGSGAGSYASFMIKAYNLFGTVPDGNVVWLDRDCDGWYVIATACP